MQNHSRRMRRLVAADLLPERAGQPVKAWAHISLADLLAMDGSSALQEEWTARVRAQWAGHRAAASAGGGDGGAWLDGDAAAAMTCDAAMAPVVTGEVNPAALEDLIRLCVELHRLRDPGDGAGTGDGSGHRHRPGGTRAGHHAGLGGPRAGGDRQGGGPAVGPGRPGRLPAAPAAGRPAGRPEPAAGHRGQPEHPGLDPQRRHPARQALPVGRTVRPARRACEVHHVRHKKNGGKTSTKDCVLLCFFHHQVVIHRWGWTLVLNPDGTTTAWNKDKTKVLHSHSPPARPG